jgi:hypothetical protein
MVRWMPAVAPFHQVKIVFRSDTGTLAGCFGEGRCGATIGGRPRSVQRRPAAPPMQDIVDDDLVIHHIYCRKIAVRDNLPRLGVA